MARVSDTGVGITADEIPTLFSKFGKLHRTAEINNAGIGLGLTIVKEIVERSGGFIKAESGGLNMGSVFTFTIVMQSVETSAFNLAVEEAAPHDPDSHSLSQSSLHSQAVSQDSISGQNTSNVANARLNDESQLLLAERLRQTDRSQQNDLKLHLKSVYRPKMHNLKS